MLKVKIELLNVIKYETKEKKQRTMITYRLLDKDAIITSSEKMKGYATLNAYFDGYEVYNKIPVELCGTACDMELESKVSSYDPTKETKVVKTIADISLV